MNENKRNCTNEWKKLRMNELTNILKERIKQRNKVMSVWMKNNHNTKKNKQILKK